MKKSIPQPVCQELTPEAFLVQVRNNQLSISWVGTENTYGDFYSGKTGAIYTKDYGQVKRELGWQYQPGDVVFNLDRQELETVLRLFNPVHGELRTDMSGIVSTDIIEAYDAVKHAPYVAKFKPFDFSSHKDDYPVESKPSALSDTPAVESLCPAP